MARKKRILTYDRCCKWFVKRVAGKKRYLHKADSETDKAAYQAALKRYHEVVAELQSATPTTGESAHSSHGKSTPHQSKQLATLVAKYLHGFKRREQTGDLTPGRYKAVRYWVRGLTDHFGDRFPVHSLKESDITSYTDHLDAELECERFSPFTVYQKVITMRSFVRWAYEEGHLKKLPRNLSRYSVKIPVRKPQIFHWQKEEGEEVQRLLTACKARDELLYLCVLIALNTGMNLQDLSDLRGCDFNWKRKDYPRIQRARSKTQVWGSWVLWGETYDLLMKHKKVSEKDYGDEDVLLLRLPNGDPIIKPTSGGHSRIARHFREVVLETFPTKDPDKPETRTWKTLRKTIASYCAWRWSGTETLLLAHAPKTNAARFYINTNPTNLDKVLCFAEVAFGLSASLVKRYPIDRKEMAEITGE